MIPRDEIVSIAREAGMTQLMGQTFHGHAMTPDVLERFAALVVAKVIASTPPPPLVVSMSDVDQAQLAAMLEKAPAMPLVVAPDDSKLAACFDQIKSDLIADGAVEHDLRLEFFPEAVLDAFRRQRAARIEAQQRLADMQDLAIAVKQMHLSAAAELERQHAEIEALRALLSKKPIIGSGRTQYDRLIKAARNIEQSVNSSSSWGCIGPDDSDIAWQEFKALASDVCTLIDSPPDNEALKAERAHSGLAHRKAVQEAVAEAVAAEREACEERVVSLFEVLETPYLPDITRAIRARGTA